MVTKKPEPTEDPWMVDNEGNKLGRAEYSSGITVVPKDREWATITLKAGTGYNAPWLVFKPTSIEDAKDIMQHEDLEELIDLVARRNKEFERAFGGAPVAASKPAASSGGWKGKPAASSSSDVPSGTCPTHNCDLVKVDGFTKRDGTAVSARVGCPVPKCYAKTFWQNDDGTWTEK